MSALSLRQVPPAWLPGGGLLLALAWGCLAALLFAFTSEEVLRSRWTPMALALTHMLTLGLLGNALVAGLLQFLPAAAGVPLAVLPGALMLVLLNVGTVALLTHFLWATAALWPALLLGPGLLLGGLWLLCAAGRARPVALAHGLRLSLLMLLLAASLGLLLLAARSGHLALPRTLAVDLHAVLGLWGWGFGVLLCVASLAMPMLQGTPRWPPRALSLLLALLGPCLLASVWLHAQSRPFWGLPIALPPLLAAGLHLWQLRRARWRRNLPLRAAFAGSGLILGVAVLAWAMGAGTAAALFALAAGLPPILCAMALEILAFVCWIDLHRRAGRGRRLPGVHALLPDSGKWSVLALLGGHAVLLFFGMVRLRELLPFAALLAAAGLALAFMLALRARRRAEVFLCAG